MHQREDVPDACSRISSASCRSAGQLHRPDHHGVDAEHIRVRRRRIMRRQADGEVADDRQHGPPSVLNRRPAASMIRCRIACLCSLLYRTPCSFTPGPAGFQPRTLFRVRS